MIAFFVFFILSIHNESFGAREVAKPRITQCQSSDFHQFVKKFTSENTDIEKYINTTVSYKRYEYIGGSLTRISSILNNKAATEKIQRIRKLHWKLEKSTSLIYCVLRFYKDDSDYLISASFIENGTNWYLVKIEDYSL